jgi:hypothetical protein
MLNKTEINNITANFVISDILKLDELIITQIMLRPT